jgi:hypothetical protein
MVDAELLRRAAGLLRARAIGGGGCWQAATTARGTLHNRILDEGVVVADVYATAPVVEWMTTLTPSIGLQLAKVLQSEARTAGDGSGADGPLVELARQIIGWD